MSNIRTFIAIEISPDVRGKAAALIKRLRESEAKTSWTRPENMHLTLKFLGDTPDPLLPDVCRAVEKAVQDMEPFMVSFRQVGAFPRHEHPRTVWIGVEQGLEQLRQMQQRIEDELYEAGFQRERRKFMPHLTVGRVREGGSSMHLLGEMILENRDFVGGEVIVEDVIVFASFREPEGPTHQVVGHAELLG
jgi:2'-5' RNA ligase